jgi:hypothetical protein
VDDGTPVSERLALARLCARLPDIRERAEQGSWSDELEERVDEVAAGASAVAACRALGLLDGRPTGPAYDPDGSDRAAGEPDSGGASLPGLDDAVLTGRYGCPLGRCARRGQRDDRARPPVCELTGAPMVFRME